MARVMSMKIRFLVVLATLMGPLTASADEAAEREALLAELEYLTLGGQPAVRGVSIASAELLEEFYAGRNYTLAWTNRNKIEDLIAGIEASPAAGFNVEDYHLQEIQRDFEDLEAGRLTSPEQLATLDLMLTDSLVRYAYHERFGRVNPYDLDGNWNFNRSLDEMTAAEAIETLVEARSPIEQLHTMVPKGRIHTQLQTALARYREIAATGGWPQIAAGKTIRPNDTDDRLASIEQRLASTGDLELRQRPSGEATYDAYLQNGVRLFQVRHGLDADGVIGPATIAAMNVPVEKKVDQLRVNLERSRWVSDDIEDDFFVVNIAGFEAFLVRDGQVIWDTRVQVGKPYHQTPVFRDEITYLAINPTWTVPYSIATREMLPKLKNDPNYLYEREFDVKDRDGNTLDSRSIDWDSLSRGNFPYTLVQRPGPANALGRVKFMFPNKFSVYLHDTPSKYLFEKAGRAFSHGCIRTENPFELAELLLGPQGWDAQRIQDTLDTGELTNVSLETPLPVLLLYFTARVRDDGAVLFFEDVYERDARITAALDAPFTFVLPEG